jgi:hypothetical protein
MRYAAAGNESIPIDELVNSLHPESRFARGVARWRAMSISRGIAYAIALLGWNLGARRALRADAAGVRTASELSGDVLRDLFENRCCAVRIPNYVSGAASKDITEWILGECELAKWGAESNGKVETDMYYGIGLPINATKWSKASCRQYFEQVLPAIRKLRGVNRDLNPVDKLRLELDELWPHGAHIDSIAGRKRMVGMGRVMRPEGLVDGTQANGIIHVDDWPLLTNVKGTFSANTYLKVPSDGGKLCIWSITPTLRDCFSSATFFIMLRDVFRANGAEKERQKVLLELLPPPLVIKPMEGELIIFNSARPHAVTGFGEGCRVTLHTFISYQMGMPLALYC